MGDRYGRNIVISVENDAPGYSYRVTLASAATNRQPIDTTHGLNIDLSYQYRPGDGTYVIAYYIHICGGLTEDNRHSIPPTLDNGGVPLAARNAAIDIFYEMYDDDGSVDDIIPIKADLWIDTYHTVADEMDEIDRVLEMSNEDLRRPTPASRAAVDALEKVVIGSNADNRDMSCRVCLEEFSVGYEATKMPCSHVFHGDCIVKWLETRFVCPLCRFELPQDEEPTPEDGGVSESTPEGVSESTPEGGGL